MLSLRRLSPTTRTVVRSGSPMLGEHVTTFHQMWRRWLSQDVARLNAATAANRLTNQRQDRQSVETYLTYELNRQLADVPPDPPAALNPVRWRTGEATPRTT
jgi:hypothetical protein